MSAQQPLRGFCGYYGADEGIFWVFQDARLTGIRADHVVICTHCEHVWNKKENPDGPKLIDLAELDEASVSYLADAAKIEQDCPGHEWTLLYPNGTWSHEGMNILSNGDVLTIFDKTDRSRVLWSGKIKYRPRYIGGAHLRRDLKCFQAGVDHQLWEGWFRGGYPAELTLGRASLKEQRHLNKKDQALKDQGRD